MWRWQWVLPVVALAVISSEGYLLHRTLEGVDRESAIRGELLVERFHAELQRRLADVIVREDERPFTHWRNLYVPEGGVPGLPNLAVSPLARLPDDPAIVGWVQFDPDGSFHTPMEPRAEELARLGVSIAPDPVLAKRIEDLHRRVRPAQDAPLANIPVPIELPMQTNQANSSYTQVEQYLNRKIVDNDQQSRSRVVPSSISSVNGFADPGNASRAPQALQQQLNDVSCFPAGWGRAAPTGVVVGPFRRVTSTADSILLLRDVELNGQQWRQGVVFDRLRLEAWLASDLLDDPERPFGLSIAWDNTQGQAFTPPFDDVAAVITVPVDDDVVAARRRSVWVFGLGLLVLSVLGLGAVQVAVVAVLRDVRRRQDFVAAVTHELKTPLTAIRLHGEMLRDGLVPDATRQNEYHATIVAETERLSRLIGNVLDLARLERGEAAMSLHVGDPRTVLEEAISIVGPHARSRGFELELIAPVEVVHARFDRDALLQVVINLVDNAIKFADQGREKRISLSVAVVDGRPEVSVADRGPGVPSEDLRRIFRPFWRGGRELTRRAPGTGIGLALVRSLMLAMGGQVTVDNRSEGGLLVRCQLAT